MITFEMLRDDLDIINTSHRSMIMSTINRLFPNSVKNCPVGVPSSRYVESTYASICCKEKMDFESMESIQIREDTSPRWKQGCSSVEKINSESSSLDTSTRSRQLILALTPEQRIQGNQIDDFLKRFAEFHYDVTIRPSGTKSDLYVVYFQDEESANRAYREAEAIGYKLTKKRGQRPSPNFMVKFQALRELTIRSGKSMFKRVVGRVNKNDVVIVNQVKGRRARVVKHHNKRMVKVGWVSLYTSKGVTLMKRLGDKYE